MGGISNKVQSPDLAEGGILREDALVAPGRRDRGHRLHTQLVLVPVPATPKPPTPPCEPPCKPRRTPRPRPKSQCKPSYVKWQSVNWCAPQDAAFVWTQRACVRHRMPALLRVKRMWHDVATYAAARGRGGGLGGNEVPFVAGALPSRARLNMATADM